MIASKGEITDFPADVWVELLAHLVLLREKGFDWDDQRSTASKAPNTRT